MGKGRRAKSGRIGTCAVEGASSVFLRGKRDGSLHQPGLAQERDRNYAGALRPGGNVDKRPENCGYGLPAMLGGRGPGRQGLQTSNDGRGAELPGEATGTGLMFGVREGTSKEVTIYTLLKQTWKRKRGGGTEGQQGRQIRGRRAQNL